ncbi:hypothetical protein tpqmel_0439 [Candidatus Gastranaerophilus sp. (ex Termes propinquus)]|nr:hypothetical protein tpqmel_0439 [Candidatus Gastranaerophilus sp. (ex Termes propinquus)]
MWTENKISKKDIKGVVVYAAVFLLINYSFVLMFIPYSYFVLDYACKPDTKMCGFLEMGLFALFSQLLKLIVPIWGSLYIIKKFNNKALKSIYNNFVIPTIIFLFCVCFDYIMKTYIIKYGYYHSRYDVVIAATKTFLPVYIIAMINTVKLKFFKKSGEVR